ncbi:MAG: AAA family ATPase [Planctomycetota bacterium]
MLLKRIEASSLPEALERVRAECGDDALVVETRSTRTGFLVVAARPDTELPRKAGKATAPTAAARDQLGRPAQRLLPDWTRGFAPLAQKAEEFGLSRRILTAVENALLGTKVELGRQGDPALPRLAARVLQALLAQETRFEGRPVHRDFHAVALVGPTGVGKTTTLGKLAARAVQQGQDIAIVTVDTYRVAAVEQLRAFADLLDVPMEVAFTPQDLRRTLQRHADRDRVYIDTTGRSPLDTQALQAGSAALPGSDIARLLCLGAGTRRRDAEVVIDAHDRAGIDGVCITKWDETTMPGEALSAVVERGLKFTHLGIGQEVPQDLVEADAQLLASAAFDLPAEVRR